MTCDARPPDEQMEWELPATEALLAGVLALMTAYSQSQDPHHRRLMANKAVQNLRQLAGQGRWSDSFRQMLHHVEQHWVRQTLSLPAHVAGQPCASPQLSAGEHNHAVVRQVGGALGVDNARALWHIAPDLMQ